MSDNQSDNRLQEIQALQFTDKAKAESLLLAFIRETFPQLDALSVQLRPLAVSLNSFNGFLTLADGKTLFFKTHVEPNSIVGEYYNSSMLAEAGYPVIRPLHVSTEYGKQFLIYEVIDAPSVFDVARAIERGEQQGLVGLTEAQNRADDQLLAIYLKTLERQSADDAAKAPVHQLFHHRLGARYNDFYVGKEFALPGGMALKWENLSRRRWEINGVYYNGTIAAAVDRARTRLEPARADWSVVGHGDAHNGNVFYTPNGLTYFDPAFGGRHHPLLDLTKPLFHNVFATWMYHPREVDAAMKLTWYDDGKVIHVQHNYLQNYLQSHLKNGTPSPIRTMFFESKVSRVLQPFLVEMYRRERAAGRQAIVWDEYLRSALMCCPLLTMNLADRQKFPPTIGLLGLCFVIQMAWQSETPERVFFDQRLIAVDDAVDEAL
jgi:hypothetical protein